MRYQKLGNTDIDVSVITLGTWGLGGGSVWTDKNSTGSRLRLRKQVFFIENAVFPAIYPVCIAQNIYSIFRKNRNW